MVCGVWMVDRDSLDGRCYVSPREYGKTKACVVRSVNVTAVDTEVCIESTSESEGIVTCNSLSTEEDG